MGGGGRGVPIQFLSSKILLAKVLHNYVRHEVSIFLYRLPSLAGLYFLHVSECASGQIWHYREWIEILHRPKNSSLPFIL